jgi:hypothetical protein
VVLLRMNESNLTLYNTHDIGDKGDKPSLESIFYFN